MMKNNESNNITGLFRDHGWVTVIITSLTLIVGGLIYLGSLNAQVDNAHNRMDRIVGQMNTLNQRLDNLIHEIVRAKNEAVAEIRALTSRQDDPVVYANGKLSSGYDMGVTTSEGLTEWVSKNEDSICMAYPEGQDFGAVFITVGSPTQPPRPARDLSHYQSLLIELRGAKGGEDVRVGIKDNTDPDDGSETKVLVENLTTSWDTYEIPLSRFRTADIERLYVVTEFVFEDTPQTVCFQRIEFLP